jgi:hypothetical protein
VTQVAELLRASARDVPPKGFDRKTGFGIVNVRNALQRTAPRRDPLEPNDDVLLVDGRITGTPARFVLPRGRGNVGLRARLDYTDDPLDVYRVALRRGERLRVTLVPLDDDCDLAVWPPTAQSVGFVRASGRQVEPVARSIRPGFKRDSVVLQAAASGTHYVDVRGNGRYDLVLRRLPRR